MRKQIIENAAYEVATQVRAVEDVIDSALSEIAELQARVMRVDAVAGLVETRGAIVACHAELVDAKGKVPGLRTVSWGDGDDCDDARKIAFTDLRVVA